MFNISTKLNRGVSMYKSPSVHVQYISYAHLYIHFINPTNGSNDVDKTSEN